MDFDTEPSLDFSQSELQPNSLKATSNGKDYSGTTESIIMTSGYQEDSPVGGKAKPRNF